MHQQYKPIATNRHQSPHGLDRERRGQSNTGL
ncbi:MAG: hypothetical protein N838_00815 [Thiohalocapsa sp. PB-PSB1]|nr:MAG: hypothetical protein N838_00815 [Thiohalocapsa sp. PB-PSB1]